MTTERWEKIAARTAILLIVLATFGNFVYLVLDQSDEAAGYDHPSYNSALFTYDLVRDKLPQTFIVSHGFPPTLLYLLTTFSALVFGINDFSFMLFPTVGYFLILLFAYLIGKKVGSGRTLPGFLAAATTALCPFVFGLARRFSPWTLVMGFFLAFLYACYHYFEKPSPSRVISIFLAFFLGISCAHDANTQLLFGFFAILPLLYVIFEAPISKKLPWSRALLHLLLVIVLVGSSMLMPCVIWWRQASTQYIGTEAVRFGHSVLFSNIHAYFTDMIFNTLGPLAAFPLLFLFYLFIRFYQKKISVFWVGLPMLCLAVMSLIPKKNTWYIFEILCVIPLVASLSLDAVLRARGPKGRAAILGVWFVLLGATYAAGFFPGVENGTALLQGLLERPIPVAAPLVARPDGPTLKIRIDSFMERFDEFFPGRSPLNLGIVVDGKTGVEVAPYYLRSHGRPLNVTLAALALDGEPPPAPEAVLLIPGGCERQKASDILSDENAFYNTYSYDLYRSLIYLSQSGFQNSREAVLRRLRQWRGAQIIDLPEGTALITFRPAEP